MSERLRETFRQAASGEPHPGDAWGRFERTRSRATAWRASAAGALALGIALVMVFTLPGTNQGPPSGFFGGGEVVPPTAAQQLYDDPVAGFRVAYPAAWVADGRPGSGAVIHPAETSTDEAWRGLGLRTGFQYRPEGFVLQIELSPETGTPSCGPDTICVGPGLLGAEDFMPLLRRDATRLERSVTSVAGRPAVLVEMTFPPDKQHADGDYLCIGCRLIVFTIDWFDGWTLEMRLVGPDGPVFDRNRDRALDAVRSLTRAPASPRS